MIPEDNKAVEEMKDPWLSVLLSKLIPGAGQVYAGAKGRGIFFIGYTVLTYLCMLAAVAVFLGTDDKGTFRTLLLAAYSMYLLLIVLSIYALFDAYRITKRGNLERGQASSATVNRKPWLAAFLSSLLPGLGQFYNRQWFKGLALIAAFFGALMLEDVSAALFILGATVLLAGIKDAFDSAEKLNGSGGRFFGQQKKIVSFVAIMTILSVFPLPALIKNNFVQAFKIPNGAMQPTLKIGDQILTVKTKASLATLKRGDIIVFPYPENPEKNFIKRVIGMGGDKVEFINGKLFLNDQPVPSRLIAANSQESSGNYVPVEYEEQLGDKSYRVQYLLERTRLNQGPWLVPQNSVFVLGDNRDNSMDSRVWGFVGRNTIIAKAAKIYWSWDREDGKVRWERIGETIE